MTSSIRLLFIGIIACLTSSACALVASSNLHKVPIWPHAEIYIDEDKSTSINEILSLPRETFRAMQPSDLNPGISDRRYWIRFTIESPRDANAFWVIHPEISYLDYLNLYLVQNDKVVHTLSSSDQTRFADRSFEYRFLNLVHEQPANTEYEAYVELGMITPDTLSLNLMLSNAVKFERYSKREQMVMGMYYGACLTLFLISALLGWILRSKIYWIYSGYLLSNAFLWAYLNGYVFQFLFPDSPDLFNKGFHVVYLAFSILAIEFSRNYLEIRSINSKFDTFLRSVQILFVMGIVLRLFGNYAIPLYLSFFGIAFLSILPAVGWYCFKRGASYAKWYLVAWMLYSVTLVLSIIAAISNTIEWGMKPLLYAQFAGLLESFLLALALVEKVKQLNSEISIVTQEAMHDELTQLGNRRLLNSHASHVLKHMQDDESAWLILIDADYFKQVNDEHGHPVGDKVLKHLARTIRDLSRPEDLLVRYGGEEFIMMIRTFDESTIKSVADRIRHHIKQTPYQDADYEIPLTVSLGLCPVHNNDIQQAIQFADIALYHAKSIGRDTACVYVPETHKVDVVTSTL